MAKRKQTLERAARKRKDARRAKAAEKVRESRRAEQAPKSKPSRPPKAQGS
jgi:hypothetical protein